MDFAAGAAACSGRNERGLRKICKKSERGCPDNQEHFRRVTLMTSKKGGETLETGEKLWTVDGDVGSSFECLTISREARYIDTRKSQP